MNLVSAINSSYLVAPLDRYLVVTGSSLWQGNPLWALKLVPIRPNEDSVLWKEGARANHDQSIEVLIA
jgi:hypothetical protein